MTCRLSFHPFRLTVKVWRFLAHTAPVIGGRRVFVLRLGGKVYRMRVRP